MNIRNSKIENLNSRSQGNAVIAIIVGVMAFIIFAFAVAYYALFGKLPTLATPTGNTTVAVSNSCVTPILPRIKDPKKFADAIYIYTAKYSVGKSSPFQKLSSDFVNAGIVSGVNPAWVVNIARKESNFGKLGWAAMNANNAFGRTASSSQPSITSPRGIKWYKYVSFKDSIAPQAAYLKSHYLDRGKKTFETITAEYAPPEENDTAAYIIEMKQWVGEVVRIAGDSLECKDGTGDTATPAS